MGVYQAVVGAKITAAEWNTLYNLLKGVVGGEDTIKLANNVEDTLLLEPNDSPPSPVDLFRVSQEPGWPGYFAVRSDGAVYLGDQYMTPGTLENGLLWRNGQVLYARLDEATVIVVGSQTRTMELYPTVWAAYEGAPTLSTSNYILWPFSATVDMGVIAQLQIPFDWKSGTALTMKLHWVKAASGSGNVRWELLYKHIAAEAALNAAFTTIAITDAVPSGVHYWKELTLETFTPDAGDKIVLVLRRDADHAEDTYASPAGLVGFLIDVTTVR
jgi:hypothetical protein